ncbi:hypothetical protein BKA70DRAFT_1316116 [Coprinopsis sp. MPI-PUGE-AT-0042]|nr:hypothetical protein BKA70DRAFT_1316116 [Coprinopsis sp. MPI-PUGE-AT-0042]
MAFPSPIGGVPLPSEFGACVLFVVLYALLLPLMVHDVVGRRSRTAVSVGIMVFAIERIVVYTLRMLQTRNEAKSLSEGHVNYQQTSFGMGYVGLSLDLLGAVRCLLLNPTYGPERFPESPAAATKDCYIEPPSQDDEDRPQERYYVRRYTDIATILFIVGLVLGILGNSNYYKVLTDVEKAKQVPGYRHSSASVVLFTIAAMASATVWSCKRQPRAGKRGVITTCIISVLLAVIASYRLSVVRKTTPALDSMDAESLNTTYSKVLFYVFHAAPEWLICALMLCVNVRKTFGTGPFGDFRSRDETPEEKEKRLKRKAERYAKKEAKKRMEGIELGQFTKLG